MDFEFLVDRCNVYPSEIAKYLEVSERTLNRWIKNGAPGAAHRALEYRAGYHKDWPGFRFQNQHLITPAGYSVRAIEIDQIPWFQRMHYTNGQAEATNRLKAKAEAASQMDQIALETLKSEIMDVISNFDWSVDRYFRESRPLPMDRQKWTELRLKRYPIGMKVPRFFHSLNTINLFYPASCMQLALSIALT